jgi:hypothetical protein
VISYDHIGLAAEVVNGEGTVGNAGEYETARAGDVGTETGDDINLHQCKCAQGGVKLGQVSGVFRRAILPSLTFLRQRFAGLSEQLRGSAGQKPCRG